MLTAVVVIVSVAALLAAKAAQKQLIPAKVNAGKSKP